jgi:hypothetical protein
MKVSVKMQFAQQARRDGVPWECAGTWNSRSAAARRAIQHSAAAHTLQTSTLAI